MNAIQIKDRIDFYNDLTRVPRFPLEDYVKAFNDVTRVFMDTMIGDINGRKNYDLQLTTQVRDNIYTLIETSAPTITAIGTTTTTAGSFVQNNATKPTNYYNFIALEIIIDGVTYFCRPTSYGEIGPLRENTFKKPSNTKVYYNENKTGFSLWRGTGGTLGTATLTYIKTPAVFSLGATSQYITSGNLTVATYIACEETVFAGTTYTSGTEFTGAVAALTSGRVILKSNTLTSDLPEKTHEVLCKMASGVMLASIGMVQSSAIVNNEVNKNN